MLTPKPVSSPATLFSDRDKSLSGSQAMPSSNYYSIAVRVHQRERFACKRAAELAGMTVSAWSRKTLVGALHPTDFDAGDVHAAENDEEREEVVGQAKRENTHGAARVSQEASRIHGVEQKDQVQHRRQGEVADEQERAASAGDASDRRQVSAQDYAAPAGVQAMGELVPADKRRNIGGKNAGSGQNDRLDSTTRELSDEPEDAAQDGDEDVPGLGLPGESGESAQMDAAVQSMEQMRPVNGPGIGVIHRDDGAKSRSPTKLLVVPGGENRHTDANQQPKRGLDVRLGGNSNVQPLTFNKADLCPRCQRMGPSCQKCRALVRGRKLA